MDRIHFKVLSVTFCNVCKMKIKVHGGILTPEIIEYRD